MISSPARRSPPLGPTSIYTKIGPIRSVELRRAQQWPRPACKRKGHPATGRPLLQGRIVPTEASKFRQNFLRKSYEPKNGGVKRFLGNKCLCLQSFTKSVNIAAECCKMRKIRLFDR